MAKAFSVLYEGGVIFIGDESAAVSVMQRIVDVHNAYHWNSGQREKLLQPAENPRSYCYVEGGVGSILPLQAIGIPYNDTSRVDEEINYIKRLALRNGK